MNYGLIVAAGKGERFGAEKQFLLLKDRPILYYALKPFQESHAIDEIILVVRDKRIPAVRAEVVEKFGLSKIKHVVAGGAERQDSVWEGLKNLPDSGMVAIHDGVRPFVSPRLITEGLTACETHHAVIYGLPIADTVKRIIQGRVGETVDRSQLYSIQTPQFFDLALIKTAFQQAGRTAYYGTDDAALVERLGKPVFVLPGNPVNIKITTPDDLELAEAILTKWNERD
jgi:2-C-methyl-D-erythritol 4-phosphate cytidylyltransferase